MTGFLRSCLLSLLYFTGWSCHCLCNLYDTPVSFDGNNLSSGASNKLYVFFSSFFLFFFFLSPLNAMRIVFGGATCATLANPYKKARRKQEATAFDIGSRIATCAAVKM